MTFFVGSTNPVKINAVTLAIAEHWPSANVKSVDVPSGISDQPLTDEETRQGARNRAMAAIHDSRTAADEEAELIGIGLEGGVYEIDGEVWSTVWACVCTTDHELFESNGARFKLPEHIAQPLLHGEEMGDVVGKMAGDPNLKRRSGMIGLITSGIVDRTEEYTAIAKLAIGLWYGSSRQNDQRQRTDLSRM